MAFHTMEDALKKITEWEERLSVFYRGIHSRLKNERTRKVVDSLKQRHEKSLNIIRQINPADYQHSEFMKYLPPDIKPDALPGMDSVYELTPEELFMDVIAYEEKIEDYFTRLKNIVVYPKSKELAEMLIRYKLEQIKEIKALLDGYELAV